MKKNFLWLAAFSLFISFAASAQGGGMRMPIPDRVKMIMDKLADFKLILLDGYESVFSSSDQTRNHRT